MSLMPLSNGGYNTLRWRLITQLHEEEHRLHGGDERFRSVEDASKAPFARRVGYRFRRLLSEDVGEQDDMPGKDGYWYGAVGNP